MTQTNTLHNIMAKVMRASDFNIAERKVIGKYVHGYQVDSLIKGDAIDLINVLHYKHLLDAPSMRLLTREVQEASNDVATKLALYLLEVVSEEARNEIMAEFYAQKTSI
jgi:hypothetical protein